MCSDYFSFLLHKLQKVSVVNVVTVGEIRKMIGIYIIIILHLMNYE